MSLAANKALARRYFEDAPFNPAVCEQIFAPTVRFHALVQTANHDSTSNPQAEKEAYEWLKTVWGGWHVTVDEMIAEDDRVMVLVTFRGTHQGEYQGLPPSHKQVTYRGINIFRIEDGRIAEVWDMWDRLGLWQQLGVLPDIRQAVAHAAAAESTTSDS